jgi:hypothetical protein
MNSPRRERGSQTDFFPVRGFSSIVNGAQIPLRPEKDSLEFRVSGLEFVTGYIFRVGIGIGIGIVIVIGIGIGIVLF